MSYNTIHQGNYSVASRVREVNERILRQCANLTHTEGYCPSIVSEFRNIPTCWPPTPPGAVANNPCPKHDIFDSAKFFHKKCMPDGKWFVGNNGTQWTNYTECMDLGELEFFNKINDLYVIGYSISLVALLISLTIFLSFRSLKCTRIRIHIQLFLSFIMNNTMWVIWYRAVILGEQELKEENPIWCQSVEILLKYSLIANYMWMFCEGLYLHISLVVVFVRDEVAWIWFLLIGWGIPGIIILIYSYARIFHYRDTAECWLKDSNAAVIYMVPVCITLAASLVFLFNVLRVIMTIMHPNSNNPAPTRVRKAARAALILIPLFGLQYILIPFRPGTKDPLAHLYEYVSFVITSFQGLCVSCLFCFANQDVQHAISGAIKRRLNRSAWNNCQCTTGTAESAVGVFFINGSNTGSIRLL